MPNDSLGSIQRRIHRLALVALALPLASCVTANNNTAAGPPAGTGELRTASIAPTRPRELPYFRAPHATPKSFDGVASYYWEDSRVANGAPFDPNGLTAAHRWLPLGTRVRVSDPKSGRSVIVTINDRGPFVQGRVLDLSLGAARALKLESRGITRVHGEVLGAHRSGQAAAVSRSDSSLNRRLANGS